MAKHLVNPLNNKRGVALLSVMLIFSVMSIMLGGMTVYSTSHLQRSDSNTQTAAAYYAAEAGLNYETERFIELINIAKDEGHSFQQLQDTLSAYITANHNKSIDFNSDNIDATVAISTRPNQDDMVVYRITSTGIVNGQERVVSRDIIFTYVPGGPDPGNGFVIDKAVLSKTTIQLGTASVEGIVGTYLNSSSAITMTGGGSNRVWGVQIPNVNNYLNVVKVPQNNYNQFIKGGVSSITDIIEVFDYPPIVMPSYPSVGTLPRLPNFIDYTSWGAEIIRVTSTVFNLGQSGQAWAGNYTYTFPSSSQPQMFYVPQINIGNNSSFTVNVGSNHVTLVVDKLNISSAFQVEATTGSLSIYVTGNTSANRHRITDKLILNMSNGTGHIGNINSPEKFKVFVNSIVDRNNNELEMSLTGSSRLYMSLMAANLNLKVAGSAGIDGYFVTGGKKMTFTGGSSTSVSLYYAPNATVTMSGGGLVNGAMIVNKFVASGGAKVVYSSIAFDNFPFAVFDPVTGGGENNDTSQFELKKGPTFEHNKLE